MLPNDQNSTDGSPPCYTLRLPQDGVSADDTLSAPMKLTKLQLQSLKLYLRWHADPPTFASLARASLRSWLALACVATAGAFLILGGWLEAGWATVGIVGGAFCRDIGRFRVLLKVWPAHDGVTDWARVREVIEIHEGVTQAEGPARHA